MQTDRDAANIKRPMIPACFTLNLYNMHRIYPMNIAVLCVLGMKLRKLMESTAGKF
jgi:hypothetical protein